MCYCCLAGVPSRAQNLPWVAQCCLLSDMMLAQGAQPTTCCLELIRTKWSATTPASKGGPALPRLQLGSKPTLPAPSTSLQVPLQDLEMDPHLRSISPFLWGAQHHQTHWAPRKEGPGKPEPAQPVGSGSRGLSSPLSHSGMLGKMKVSIFPLPFQSPGMAALRVDMKGIRPSPQVGGKIPPPPPNCPPQGQGSGPSSTANQ